MFEFFAILITFLDGLVRRPELRVTKKQHLSYYYIFERGCVRCGWGVWVGDGVCGVWVCVCVGACVGCGAVREIQYRSLRFIIRIPW